MKNNVQTTPWLLWPLKALLDLIEGIIKWTGRLVAAVFGLAMMIVGVVLTILVITAPLGIPMIIFGFLLMIRGIF